MFVAWVLFSCVVFWFIFFQWMSGTLQSSNMWLSLLYWHNQWLVHFSKFYQPAIFSVQIQGFKTICKNGLKLAECEIWISSHCRFRIAYCISLDASTACAVHILDFIKIKKLNCTVYSFVKRHSSGLHKQPHSHTALEAGASSVVHSVVLSSGSYA